MKNYEEARNILKKDSSSLGFINKKVKEEIEKDIEECLKKQQEEINKVKSELKQTIKAEFSSLTEFKLFVVHNVTFEISSLKE